MTKNSLALSLMSGNHTSKPSCKSYFLDTCIYINYGLSFDPFNTECTCFFNSNHKKYTSKSVVNEIEKFKSFMSRISRDLSLALTRNKCRTVVKHPFSVFRGYYDNQESVIVNVLAIINTNKAEEMISKYRAFKRLTLEQIDVALSKTEDSQIPASVDTKFIEHIRYIGNDADAQIIADAAIWASNFSIRHFCTSDKKHILQNKVALMRDINNHYGHNCLGFVHVKDVQSYNK